ncbi:hypothetical protein [Stutzerimonas stutzeri]|uniref:hypothetical protein n=1 Tax=Stutzerimonas stutzeri TaxID=316 RepID=UPI001CFD563E|nr:hypothetical protein [Stutzerimonas stutzeri]
MWATLGAALSLLGALALYLASPHQRLLVRSWPPFARAGGAGCLGLALLAWLQALPALTAVLAMSLLLMCTWTALPFLGLCGGRSGR